MGTAGGGSQRLLAALAEASAYGDRHGSVERRETHISWIFFHGDRVYKVKKPVAFDFLDASTLERRLALCRAEVRLNRRLAPDTYLGVVPITQDASGAIRVGGPGRVIEHAVEMRRLPATRMMDQLLDRAEIDSGVMRTLARVLVRFHAEAPTGPGVDEHGGPTAVRAVVEENLSHLVEGTSPLLHHHLARAVDAFLAGHRSLLERRVAEGRIRDGHGDLHAGNICILPDGPIIYDCIEFSDAFRCGDVAADLAFLAMDLDHRCFRAFAGELVHRYVEASHDAELERVLPFYKLHRALVRARVARLAGDAATATDYLHLAASYTLGPALILTCGLPGSGKSHVAHALTRPFEAALIQSDVVRKRLAGVPPEHHAGDDLDAGIYSRGHGERTYAELEREAGVALDQGRTVVVDATFSTRAQRSRFVDLARGRAMPLVLVETRCPATVALARIARRALDPHAVSDADARVFRAARERFEAPAEMAAESVLHHDGTGPAVDAVAAVVERLVALGGGIPLG